MPIDVLFDKCTRIISRATINWYLTFLLYDSLFFTANLTWQYEVSLLIAYTGPKYNLHDVTALDTKHRNLN